MTAAHGYEYGVRVRGPLTGKRHVVRWNDAYKASCACDARAEPGSESYLSVYQFDNGIAEHVKRTGSPKGYAGSAWAAFAAWDLDGSDLARVLDDARALAAWLASPGGVRGESIGVSFSGRRGFHIQAPTVAADAAQPGPEFPGQMKAFAVAVATEAGVCVDEGVYDMARLLRAPNSRHPGSGLCKIGLTYAELMTLNIEAITSMAKHPRCMEASDWTDGVELSTWELSGRWTDAIEQAERKRQTSEAARREPSKLTCETLDIVRNGLPARDGSGRALMLFRAAANLAEMGAGIELVTALLADVGIDAGMDRDTVRRQIRAGVEHGSHG